MRISVITPTIRFQGLQIIKDSLDTQTFPREDFEWLVELNTSGEHDLNRAYNRLLKRAKGELIVSLQDWIKAPPDYLQRFWDAYTENPKTFFTSPVGKVNQVDFLGDIEWDWRASKKGKIEPTEWEIDSACAPREAFFGIGGFDEYLDQYWSFDNVSVAKRAAMLGYSFENLHNNPVLAFDHDKHTPHPFRDKQRPKLIQMRIDSYLSPKLPYLDCIETEE